MSALGGALTHLLWDLPGWLLVPVTFIVCIPLAGKNQRLLMALWFTIGLHHCAAITDCYLFLIPGADADAEGFHRRAAGELSSLGSPMPYDTFLSFLYAAMGPSKLFGCELSVLAYSLSALIFVVLVRWVGSQRYEVPLVLLYGSLPGAVFHQSVTMRESYQTLALLFVVWMLALVGERRHELWPYLGLTVGLSAMFLLHNGLAVFALIVAAAAVVRGARSNPFATLLICVLATAMLAFHPPKALQGQSTALDQLSSGKLNAYMADYRERLDATRASYQVRLDTSSADAFLVSFPQVLILYFYAPFPWQANGLKDFYALAESFLRMALTVGVIVNFLNSSPARRRRLLLVAVVFLALEAMWAAGTANWGQAIRHRSVAWGLFLLLGAEPVLRAIISEHSQDDEDLEP